MKCLVTANMKYKEKALESRPTSIEIGSRQQADAPGDSPLQTGPKPVQPVPHPNATNFSGKLEDQSSQSSTWGVSNFDIYKQVNQS